MKSYRKGKRRICVLEKKRGNFSLHEKFAQNEKIVNTTDKEVQHHVMALEKAGYEVVRLNWSENIISDLNKIHVDLVFNVSSLVETAILEELEIPFVGSDIVGCAIATDKALAKNLWIKNNLPTSPFIIAKKIKDCEIFENNPPINYPLFIKPSLGRGSSGIDESSLINSYEELKIGVNKRLKSIKQPVIIEKFLEGREITCGIIGNNERTRTLPLLEIIHEGTDKFLTFNKKELDDDIFECPANLSEEKTKMMKNLAISAFKTVGLHDYGRIDMILTEEGPMLLEVNSFAGLMCTPLDKPHSYMGFMAKAENKGSSEFLDEIINEAMLRLNLL